MESTKKQEMHTIVCPVSVEYKVVLAPQQTFKQDGVIDKGKRVYFRNGRAEVDEETLEQLKALPEWGVDFMLSTEPIEPAQPLRPTVKKLGNETEAEQQGQIDALTNQVKMLSKAVAIVVEKLNKPDDKEAKAE